MARVPLLLLGVWISVIAAGSFFPSTTSATEFPSSTLDDIWSAFPVSPEEAQVLLGRAIFFDPRLSSTGTVSCLSCHDPEKSFADGLVHSVGEKGEEVGRNSPTLFGIGAVDAFVDPLRTTVGIQHGVLLLGKLRERTATEVLREPAEGQGPRAFLQQLDQDRSMAITLAERCLSPLGNPAEMGESIDTTIATYRGRVLSDALFDLIFEGVGGLTRERVGLALAAYLRTLTPPPDAPFARLLAGEDGALDEAQTRGHALFTGKGACASCHAGENLRDGLVHAVMVPGAIRIRRPSRSSSDSEVSVQQLVSRSQQININRAMFFNGSSGGYGGLPVNISATPTLWDVARTAPYFGDGTIDELDLALTGHVKEMRDLHHALGTIVDSGEMDLFEVPPPQFDDSPTQTLEAGTRVLRRVKRSVESIVQSSLAQAPASLRPVEESASEWPFPEDLDEGELADLVAFLGALSPPGR